MIKLAEYDVTALKAEATERLQEYSNFSEVITKLQGLSEAEMSAMSTDQKSAMARIAESLEQMKSGLAILPPLMSSMQWMLESTGGQMDESVATQIKSVLSRLNKIRPMMLTVMESAPTVVPSIKTNAAEEESGRATPPHAWPPEGMSELLTAVHNQTTEFMATENNIVKLQELFRSDEKMGNLDPQLRADITTFLGQKVVPFIDQLNLKDEIIEEIVDAGRRELMAKEPFSVGTVDMINNYLRIVNEVTQALGSDAKALLGRAQETRTAATVEVFGVAIIPPTELRRCCSTLLKTIGETHV